MEVAKYLLYALHFLVSVTLIVLVVSQSHRSEGLGAVSGGSAPVQRGRAGVEEQLATYTKYAAVAFMTLSALLYMLGLKFHWR